MNRGAMNNLILAHAQVWGMLVTLFALIYFIWMLLHGEAHLDPTTEKMAYTILGVFLAKFGDMVGYLYNRPRSDAGSVFTPPATDEPATPAVSSPQTPEQVP